jgi:hypothetical protein
MGQRGPKPKGKVKIKWSSDFAYAVGLIATDGCLYKDDRHINLTSKDREQISNFQKALRITCNVGMKARSKEKEKKYFVLQISDVLFWNFLKSIGITPAKSKTLGPIQVSDEYFFDFLRGSFDGDGTIHSYYDPRWESSFMFYTIFCSASKVHIDWLRSTIKRLLDLKGHVTKSISQSTYQLKYAKKESVILLKKIYRNPKSIYLNRKKLKVMKILGIVGESIRD